MARYIAKNIVAAGLAEKCTVSLAYATGRAEPVAVDIDAHQTGKYPEAVLEQAVRAVFDLTPAGVISALGLDRPLFAQFCNYGQAGECPGAGGNAQAGHTHGGMPEP